MGRPRIIRRGERKRRLTTTQKFLRAIYFTPLTLLLLERLYIPLEYADLAAYLNVEGMAVSKVAKDPTKRSTRSALPLDVLTRSSNTWSFGCPKHTDTVTNFVLDSVPNDRRIPRIVHQTARSRCVTPAFATITNQWKLGNHSYFFHDDEAVARLFRIGFQEFPQLKMVVYNCVKNPTIKAELWKYLVLWVYGGIYADFDTAPRLFNASTIGLSDDSFFLAEKDHGLSQWFMAASPRHPVMFYAIQMTLQNLLDEEDTIQSSRYLRTGSQGFHAAFTIFRGDAHILVDPTKAGTKSAWSGTFEGTNNRTITVVESGDDDSEYVQRMAVDAFTRKRDYTRMGMSHFSFVDPKTRRKSGESCHDALLANIMAAVEAESSGLH
jgi:Glycosyltransferase sugar-binding region containing DXD motif